MRDDFLELKTRLREHGIDICQVSTDLYMTPNNKGYVKSPLTTDRTPSLKLYSKSDTFYDFAAAKGGDIIAFVAYTGGMDNWTALHTLSGFYDISISDNHPNRRDVIKQRLAEERKKKEREAAIRNAYLTQIDNLKRQEHLYRSALQNPQIEPYSDLWTDMINSLQPITYKLDVLLAVDTTEYANIKPRTVDRRKWESDVNDILGRKHRKNGDDFYQQHDRTCNIINERCRGKRAGMAGASIHAKRAD